MTTARATTARGGFATGGPRKTRRNSRSSSAQLVEQYGKNCPFDNGKTCINGQLTLGENIGDLAGITIAYRAYKLSLEGKEAPVIDGLTGDQRFFIAYAQKYRNKWSEQLQRVVMESDPHSPDLARVNEVLRNFDPWYEAFNVTPERQAVPGAQGPRPHLVDGSEAIGGCHCGAVRFAAQLPPPPVPALDCNCSICRRDRASCTSIVPHADFDAVERRAMC